MTREDFQLGVSDLTMNSPEETVEEGSIDPMEDASPAESGDSEETRAAAGLLRALFTRPGAPRTAILAGLAAALTLVLGGTAAWFLFPSMERDTPRGSNDPGFVSMESSGAPDRLIDQELAPFYIPLPEGTDGQMARVSFSVTWGRPSSSRFRNQKTRVRDRLYLRMTELAAEGENMRSMRLTIGTEARNILEELLRPEELRVVVTGIFIV